MRSMMNTFSYNITRNAPVRDTHNRLVIGAGHVIPDLITTGGMPPLQLSSNDVYVTQEPSSSYTTISSTEVKDPNDLIVIASAEAYTMIAGKLIEVCNNVLSEYTHRTKGQYHDPHNWREIHLRIVSDEAKFRFETTHLIAMAREQKVLTSYRTLLRNTDIDTAFRVAGEMAHMLGKIDVERSRHTHVMCLTKDADVMEPYVHFLKQLAESESFTKVTTVNVLPYALRSPHVRIAEERSITSYEGLQVSTRAADNDDAPSSDIHAKTEDELINPQIHEDASSDSEGSQDDIEDITQHALETDNHSTRSSTAFPTLASFMPQRMDIIFGETHGAHHAMISQKYNLQAGDAEHACYDKGFDVNRAHDM
ncbi:hypothetical protein CYMTET_44628 [Cymbomonas tetramitiformis]|uniref:Uncharacterized protein n=1 Tax=Cymbomonas tetramitiformis TaxID=36881 RepID=A0AAE0BZU0_9CHLO|nr:hypothetical protein CYMTET_44628 [Cymbomonas tetramitiformis]|eukprot:gene8024-9534_t